MNVRSCGSPNYAQKEKYIEKLFAARTDTYVLWRLDSLLHLNFLAFVKLAEDAKRLLIVALVAKLCGHLDLVLDVLAVVQHVDGQDTLGLDRLTIGAICRRVDDDLGLLERLLYHRLLHSCQHASRLLDSCHIHSGSGSCRVALIVDQHLLLLGYLLLIVLALGCELVISLVGVSRLTVDHCGLSEDLRISHLPWNTNLLDETAVHRGSLRGVLGHWNLLRRHILLLLLVGLVLVHTWSRHLGIRLIVVHLLAQLVHPVGVGAVVRVWTSLTRREVLAHDSLVVLEALVISLSLVATLSVVAALVTSTATSTTLSAHALEVTLFSLIDTTHLTSTTLSTDSTTTSSTAHLVESRSATLWSHESLVSTSSLHGCTATTTSEASSSAQVMELLLLLVTAASGIVATAAMIASALIVLKVASIMVVASTTLILPANSATTLILVVHTTGAASDDPSAGLQAHMIRDGIVDVAEFSIAVSVLAVLVPLAEALVLEMSALLGLEALVDRAVFDLARLGHLLLLLLLLWLHHSRGTHHWLLWLASHLILLLGRHLLHLLLLGLLLLLLLRVNTHLVHHLRLLRLLLLQKLLIKR